MRRALFSAHITHISSIETGMDEGEDRIHCVKEIDTDIVDSGRRRRKKRKRKTKK